MIPQQLAFEDLVCEPGVLDCAGPYVDVSVATLLCVVRARQSVGDEPADHGPQTNGDVLHPA